MSDWVTTSELRIALNQVPEGEAEDAALQVSLDAAEAIIGRYLIGVLIEPPAPDDLKQIVTELASSLWLTKGTASRLETAGVDGSGGFDYMGGLTPEQKGALRQIQIDAGEVAI